MNHAFPCGTLALDFVGTLRARRNAKPAEKLGAPELLGDWFTESGMFDEAPEQGSGDLSVAIELRESIYALLEARLKQAPLPEDAVAVVNRHAEGLPVSIRLVDETVTHGGSVHQGLAALARETAEIVGGEDAGLLRECSRPECTQVYLDHSRGHRREWCAMRTCGNRVKASNFRARQLAAEAR